jgi:hypothetical protein
MNLLNIKKTKYEQITEIMDKDGYVSDTQLAKIWGNETGIYKASEHIRKYKKLKRDREFFSDKNIIEKKKGHRSHLVRTDDIGDNQFYKVGKEFFNEIKLSPPLI